MVYVAINDLGYIQAWTLNKLIKLLTKQSTSFLITYLEFFRALQMR